jgi:integrase
MSRVAKEMKALEVTRLTKPGLHFVGGVSGLALQVVPSGAKTWILRVMVAGKRRDMGLGGYPSVTLAGAREAARVARAKIKTGIDPIEENRSIKSALAAARASAQTFQQCAEAYIAAKAPEWKNAKHGDQWRNTLATYAYPFIGKLLISDIEQEHVMQVLNPIWTTKTETATRLRGRIESVLDWATVRKYRSGDNPAHWRGYLNKLLPAPDKVAKVEHHAALTYNAVNSFMIDLRKQPGTGARALEFAILTAARSGEVRGATLNEVDLDIGIWTIPAARMKAGKEHQIPLSEDAKKLIRNIPRDAETKLLFPNPRGKELSDMTLTAVLRRMDIPVTAHGFRSTFRDWAGETTAYPREVIEHALAHQLKDKAEAAYARGTLFEKRRCLMVDWANYCNMKLKTGSIVSINKKQKAR